MLQDNIIFVNILRGAYRNADICFLFEEYESLRRGICSEFSRYNDGWRMKVFHWLKNFPWTFLEGYGNSYHCGDGG